MTHSGRVTIDDLRRVAELANLELTVSEQELMLRDLNSILDHVVQLNELDTSATPPMAQVSEILAASSESATHLRDDCEIPCLDRELVMSGAPDSDGTFFRVPKVIVR